MERRECPSDGRGALIGLTAQGEKVFRRAGNIHLRGFDEHVGSHLSIDELAGLNTMLTKLADRVEGPALSMITRLPAE